jgi:CDP-6-deoxy-D-xylo-4-hexulose-3-dehydrase
MSTLEANNIECRTIFSGNITKHPAYDGINMSVPFKLTHADDVMENGVFISVHPSITQEMIDFIGEVLKSL